MIDLLHNIDRLGCKPINTSTLLNHKLCNCDDIKDINPREYHRLVKKLIYLTITRNDISYIIGVLSQHMQNPKQNHREAVLIILHHLSGSHNSSLLRWFSKKRDLYNKH